MKRYFVVALFFCVAASSLHAATLTMSIGVRETEAGGGASGGPKFSNGGATLGGIEWIDKDNQTLTTDGTWQLFTFIPKVQSVTAFAGATANSVLDGEWGTLEHVRILNSDGITQPIRLWIDDISNTDSTGTASEGFEGYAAGDEVIFQEPSFSGSTASNLVAGSTAGVSSSMPLTGANSYEANFQFVDSDPTRWVRYTTFNTPNVPNPAIHFNETAFTPTISFWAKAVVIPEPSTLALVALGLFAFMATVRRNSC